MGQREPDFAEQLALSAYVENRVGEKLDYIAPVEEELVLRLRCAVVVEGERLGVEDAALTENLGADIAAYLVRVVVEVYLGADMNDSELSDSFLRLSLSCPLCRQRRCLLSPAEQDRAMRTTDRSRPRHYIRLPC